MFGLRRIMFISAFLAVFSISMNLAPAQADEGPKIVFSETEYDFGHVMEGGNIKHTFKVYNQGNKLLQIKRVSPD